MPVVCLHDKPTIAGVLRRNLLLNLYAIGDLDPFLWPYTQWLGLAAGSQVSDIILLYTGSNPPTLLATAAEPADGMRQLLTAARTLLPPAFYAHITPSLIDLFEQHYDVCSHGEHMKMALTNAAAIESVDTTSAVPLGPEDRGEIERFYAESYPENWFDPRMLETGMYFGMRAEGRLACVAGVHVYSPAERVAALGNIATRPDARGKGRATQVTARLCKELLCHVDHIGLNVKADNAAAIACYRRLGFMPVAPYLECDMRLKGLARVPEARSSS